MSSEQGGKKTLQIKSCFLLERENQNNHKDNWVHIYGAGRSKVYYIRWYELGMNILEHLSCFVPR